MPVKNVLSMLQISLLVLTIAGCGGGVSSQTTSGSPSGSGSSQGTATIHWNPVTTYTDGSSINNTRVPTGYTIYYGTTPGNYTTTVNILVSQLADQNSPRYTINGLSRGTTYYFVVSAFDASYVESDLSTEASKAVN